MIEQQRIHDEMSFIEDNELSTSTSSTSTSTSTTTGKRRNRKINTCVLTVATLSRSLLFKSSLVEHFRQNVQANRVGQPSGVCYLRLSSAVDAVHC